MKNTVILSLGALFILISCVSTKNTSTTKSSTASSNIISNLSPEISLADYLRRISGVSVKGSGADATVLIRSGGNSINLSSEPLFLIDGTEYTGGFKSISNSISVGQIKSVTVYKNASETAFYGIRGANGVIAIVLK